MTPTMGNCGSGVDDWGAFGVGLGQEHLQPSYRRLSSVSTLGRRKKRSLVGVPRISLGRGAEDLVAISAGRAERA
jgi:hypothetical protein